MPTLLVKVFLPNGTWSATVLSRESFVAFRDDYADILL